MKVGLHLPQLGRAVTPELIVEIAREAEAAGYEDLWTSEHVAVPTSMPGVPSFFPEPVALLALVAGNTARVGLGTSVLIPAYRNPMHFAKQWGTLDWLAPGRTILGVGAGWLREEFEACGVEMIDRAGRLDDYLDGWRALWRGETTFSSRYFSFRDVRVRPAPAGRARIWSGGASAGAIARAARHDGWHPTWSPVEVFAGRLAQLHAEIDRLGRERADVTVSMHVEVLLGETPAPTGYWSEAGDGYGERRVLGGSAADVAAELAPYAAAGLQHVLLTPQCTSAEGWFDHVRELAYVGECVRVPAPERRDADHQVGPGAGTKGVAQP